MVKAKLPSNDKKLIGCVFVMYESSNVSRHTEHLKRNCNSRKKRRVWLKKEKEQSSLHAIFNIVFKMVNIKLYPTWHGIPHTMRNTLFFGYFQQNGLRWHSQVLPLSHLPLQLASGGVCWGGAPTGPSLSSCNAVLQENKWEVAGDEQKGEVKRGRTVERSGKRNVEVYFWLNWISDQQTILF